MNSRESVMHYRILSTPTGPFAIRRDAPGRLCTMWVSGEDDEQLADAQPDPDLEPALTEALTRYFAGEDTRFDVPLPGAAPPFFSRCWKACRGIPRGETRSYAELAAMAGATVGASRAAGQAMRRNPLPIIVPCHRVLARSGLGGFSGSDDPAGRELTVKRWLLDLEQAVRPEHA